LLVSVAAVSGCGPDVNRASPPNIILIVIDTLRADHLGAYGYPRSTSPLLDALAARGTLFTNATAPSSWTRPAMASLFTSRPPSEHGAFSSRRALDASVATLAELLRAGGYRTIGVSGNFPHVNEQSGLDRGFDHFVSLAMPARGADDTLMRLTLREGTRPAPLRAPTASEVNARVIEALPDADERPFFLYVHYMDPHSGYLAPAAHREQFRRSTLTKPTADGGDPPAATSDYLVDLAAGRRPFGPDERARLIDLYDAEISYVDAEVGRLLEELFRRGHGSGAVVVALSDHGEEFLDHGGWFHGLTLHREVLRVPLLIEDGTGRMPPGIDERPVDLLDVPTTLLSLAGLDPAPGMRGRRLDAQERLEVGARVAELHPDALREARAGALRHRLALTAWPWKAVVDPSGVVVLFQLEDDPGELRPVAASDPSVPAALVARARELADSLRADPDASPGPGEETPLGPEEREALRALGYAK
jgi:arylsulfatase A-like enzyme